MGAKVVAVLNQKGGCGKTTTVLELAACLTFVGSKTLIVDLDSQRNTTYTTGVEGYKSNIYKLLMNRTTLTPAESIVHSQYHGDIIPGSKDMVNIECGFEEMLPDTLKHIIDSIKGDYDFVILDTHPGLGSVIIASLWAADEVIVPITPDQYSIQGLVDLSDTLNKAKTKLNAKFGDMNVLLIKYKHWLNLHKEVKANVEKGVQKFNGTLLNTNIRDSIKVSEAQANQMPLYKYALKEGITKDYLRLAEELINKWGGIHHD